MQKNKFIDFSAIGGGTAAGNYGTVNKLYEEEKFHGRQGHGFAAERANNLYDRIRGQDAAIVGDNNAKNGADRIVNGIEIQSKYCATGSRCINECFENSGSGQFRYYSKDGSPMQIEVPLDKYDAAVQAMEEKIRRGQIDGISDPMDAKKIVKKGHFTYEQARNIAKAGTVESLTYDAVNGVIIASSALGVSAMITFATSIWNGEHIDVALKKATYSGIKIGGTAFITSVIASQLSKAGLNSVLVGSSEAIIEIMGPKASAVLINAFRNGGNIYGAAAMKSAAKLLRGNLITGGVTIVILSSMDIIDIFRGRISGKQLIKNIANTSATVAGGTAGGIEGAALGSMIWPGLGTFIGGIFGTLLGGGGIGKVTNTVLDIIIEDDVEKMVQIIEEQFMELSTNYLLNKKEAEKIVDELQKELSRGKLKDMYASNNHIEYAQKLLLPIVEREVCKRQRINTPSNEALRNSVVYLLEEISDTMKLECV